MYKQQSIHIIEFCILDKIKDFRYVYTSNDSFKNDEEKYGYKGNLSILKTQNTMNFSWNHKQINFLIKYF